MHPGDEGMRGRLIAIIFLWRHRPCAAFYFPAGEAWQFHGTFCAYSLHGPVFISSSSSFRGKFQGGIIITYGMSVNRVAVNKPEPHSGSAHDKRTSTSVSLLVLVDACVAVRLGPPATRTGLRHLRGLVSRGLTRGLLFRRCLGLGLRVMPVDWVVAVHCTVVFLGGARPLQLSSQTPPQA